MAEVQDQETLAQVARLRALAMDWRTKAAETTDRYYIALMTRTAEALETEAEDLLRSAQTEDAKRAVCGG